MGRESWEEEEEGREAWEDEEEYLSSGFIIKFSMRVTIPPCLEAHKITCSFLVVISIRGSGRSSLPGEGERSSLSLHS